MRCGAQPRYQVKNMFHYLCHRHFIESDLLLKEVVCLSEGETMGCDHEIDLSEWARQADIECSSHSANRIISSLLGIHFTPEDAKRVKDAVDASTIIQKMNKKG